MADINDLQAAQTVKIVGTDSSGVESNPVNADLNGNIKAVDYATSATGSAVPTNASFIGAKNPSNNLTGLLVDASGNLLVASGSDPTYGDNDATAPTKSQLISGRDDSSILRPLLTDNQGRLVTSALTGFGAAFTFGDITTASLTTVVVRRTVYTEQTTNAQRSIASNNANDTSAGTGARTVTITYYDQTGAGPYTEVVTMNGTSYVNTTNTNICFIEKIQVTTAGSTGSNVGILTLKAATAGGGATIGTINATDNQTFWAHHYIATGKTCNVTGISCGHNGTTVGSGGLFTMKSKPIGVANATEVQVSDFVRLYGQSSTFSRVYQSPVKIVGPAKIQIYLTPESTSSIIYRAAFDYFEP